MSLGSAVEKPALVVIDQFEEWLVHCRYVSETSLRQVLSSDTTVAENVNMAAKQGVIEAARLASRTRGAKLPLGSIG